MQETRNYANDLRIVVRGNRLYDEEDLFYQARPQVQTAANNRVAIGQLPSFRADLHGNRQLAITAVPHRSSQQLTSSQSMIYLNVNHVIVFLLYSFKFSSKI